MTREEMVGAIDEEIDRLERVRALLHDSRSDKFAIDGRLMRNAVAQKANAARSSAAGEKPKRVLSPEARKRIAMAQKRRWAKQKAAAK